MKIPSGNFEELEAEFGEDLPHLLRIFIQENDLSFQQLRKASEIRDAGAIRAAAHKMKGSFMILKAIELEKLAAQIELLAGKEDIESYILDLEEIYSDVLLVIKNYLQG